MIKSETIKVDKKILWRSICRHANEELIETFAFLAVILCSAYWKQLMEETHKTNCISITKLSSKDSHEDVKFDLNGTNVGLISIVTKSQLYEISDCLWLASFKQSNKDLTNSVTPTNQFVPLVSYTIQARQACANNSCSKIWQSRKHQPAPATWIFFIQG